MTYTLKQIINQFEKEYSFLYEHSDRVAGYREAVDLFDRATKAESFRKLVSEFVALRGDFISSDREAAAFMFALDTLTYGKASRATWK